MSKIATAHPTASDPRGIVIKINKSAKDVEEAFHARMCETAEEQGGMGDAQACRREVRIAGLMRSMLRFQFNIIQRNLSQVSIILILIEYLLQ